MDIPTFRSIYPEFANTTAFPDAQVNYYLTNGTNMLTTQVWGTQQDQGVALYIAHNLVLAAQRAKAAAAGGIPGAMTGPVASKAVDKVSIGYDAGASTLEGGGAYNLTTYGVQLLQLARMFGATVFQTCGGGVGVNTGVFGDGYI